MSASEKLDRLLFELQSALDLESLWRATLRILNAALPYHSCSLLLGIVDSQAAEARHRVTAGDYFNYDSARQVRVSGPFLAAHPRIKLYTYTEVRRTDPQAPLRRLEKEVVLSAWNQFAHLVFWHGDAPEALLSVRRSAEQGDFSPAELDFLHRLHPMVEAGLQRLRQLQGERSQQAVMEQFLSSLPLPVLFIDAHGKPALATQEAYDLCALWNYGPEQARLLNTRTCFRIPAEIAQACHRLREQLTASREGPREVQLAHPQREGLTAHVALHQPNRSPWSPPSFIVTLLHEPATATATAFPKADKLGFWHALTPSERRVATLVVAGQRNREVAQALGKSLRTVEFQLNGIYKKLGIRSRTELTRLLT